MTADQCGLCKRPEPDEEWIQLAVEAAPGMRTARATSLVTTITSGFLVCPPCWDSPRAEALRAIVNSPWAQRVRPIDRCLIVCARPTRKSLILSALRTLKCPVCWHSARVERLETSTRP